MSDDIRERFEAISTVLEKSAPYHLQVECIDSFVSVVANPAFDGNYGSAAIMALYEWDI